MEADHIVADLSPPPHSIFKSHVEPDAIQSHISTVESKGGQVKQRFDSAIMKGFAASMPDEHGQSLMAASQGGGHAEM